MPKGHFAGVVIANVDLEELDRNSTKRLTWDPVVPIQLHAG